MIIFVQMEAPVPQWAMALHGSVTVRMGILENSARLTPVRLMDHVRMEELVFGITRITSPVNALQNMLENPVKTLMNVQARTVLVMVPVKMASTSTRVSVMMDIQVLTVKPI